MVLNKKLADNTFILTAASLFMSVISMVFQTWLAGRIGTAGIGLYQLVLSVTSLVMTFAISGIRFASTRLISEELADGGETIRSAMKRCFSYALFFGTAAGVVLYLTAEPVGFLWLGDARTVRPLRLSALSMPCAALCSAMSGYFIAVSRVWKSALIHIAELLTGTAVSVYLLSQCPIENIEKSCFAITQGRITADVFSLFLMSAVFLTDIRRYAPENRRNTSIAPRMLKIALPLAFSAYTRSALSTLQHILVPRALRRSGLSGEKALSGYGIIQGMALPAVFFPSCILSAAAELIVPELTAMQLSGDGDSVSKSVGRLSSLALAFSAGISIILFLLSDRIGNGIYKSKEAGYFIRLLSPLVPVMYTDMIIDGCLKGLGEQMWNMKVNILDSALSVLLVWQLLPLYALKAYIVIIYFTEILNFVLSYAHLHTVIRHFPGSGVPVSSHHPYGAPAKYACKEDT